VDLGRAHRQPPARPEHPAHGHEPLARRRGQEVHLEFHREHLVPRLHQRERGVATGAVGDGRDSGGVEVAVLLGEVIAEREADFDLAWAHDFEVGPERSHHLLLREAVAAAGLEVGVAWFEGRHSRGGVEAV